MIKTKEFVEEIIAETFCNIYERLSQEDFTLKNTLEGYFLRSCKYALWHASKTVNRLENLREDWLKGTYLSEEDTNNYITPAKEQFFKQYILPKLSTRKRRILELSYEGYSNPEIAAILGNRVNAVKVAKAQALKTAKEIAKVFPKFFEE